MPEIDLEKEKREILNAYRGLLRAWKTQAFEGRPTLDPKGFQRGS